MSIAITEEFLRDYLIARDEKYRELAHEHRQYEARLNELTALSYPTPEELTEETTLKKRKLLIKDQLEALEVTAAREILEALASRYGAVPGKSEGDQTADGLGNEPGKPAAQQAESSTLLPEETEEPDLDYREFDCEWDIRLIPPPRPQQKIKVRLKFTGYEPPRIFYDPEHD